MWSGWDLSSPDFLPSVRKYCFHLFFLTTSQKRTQEFREKNESTWKKLDEFGNLSVPTELCLLSRCSQEELGVAVKVLAPYPGAS